VHCVIIGFALHDVSRKTIYDYPDVNGEPHELTVGNINPYLVDAIDVLLLKRTTAISPAPPINYGSMAIDDGHLILEEADYKSLLKEYPASSAWIRPYMGGEELLNGTKRWCLWLENITPQELRQIPPIMERVERVKQFRTASRRATTVELAKYPSLFGERRQPKGRYMAIPKVSSENRVYLPIAMLRPNVIANGSLLVIPDPHIYSFGVLCSQMHMAWMRYVAGRMKSDYQYSNQIVYNNYPWPSDPTERQRTAIEETAQAVLDVRATHTDASLADLYDPVAMPPDLRKAHQSLDKAVDAAYGKKNFASDAERVAFLFELYHKYTSLLPAPEVQKKGEKRALKK
jgi:hypothetical protein